MAGQEYTLYAALHEDIAEGFVWLKRQDLPARCIVKLTNTENSRSVFCEALQFDKNFLKRYNQQPSTCKITEESSSIVVNHWYRARLAGGSAPVLQTKAKYPLEITPRNTLCGRLLACIDHPQVVVRVGVWLGIISVILGLLSIVLSVILSVGVHRILHCLVYQWGRFSWWAQHLRQ